MMTNPVATFHRKQIETPKGPIMRSIHSEDRASFGELCLARWEDDGGRVTGVDFFNTELAPSSEAAVRVS